MSVGRVSVDELAEMAEQHYRTNLPQAYAAIPARERATFFSDLAEQAQQQIVALADSLAGPDRAGETWAQKAGRLGEAEATARAQVIREMILPPPPRRTDPMDPTQEELDALTAAVRAFDDAKAEIAAAPTDPPATAPTADSSTPTTTQG